METLLTLLIVLIIIGAVLYLIQTVLPIDDRIKTVIVVLVIVFVCIWALRLLMGGGGALRFP